MRKIVLVLANRDFVLYNFRVEVLKRLLEEGYKVYICLPDGPKVRLMEEMGCKYIPVEIDKRGTNPVKDLKLMKKYKHIFKETNPDVILSYTTKVCIYSGIVAGKMNIPYLVNVSGLGTALEQPGILQPLMITLYKNAVRKAKCVFFQNTDNRRFFHEHDMYDGHEVLIPGSGVNLDKWKYLEYPSDKTGVQFLFVARIIKEKGIEEYLACAKVMKKEFPDSVFHVCGPCDGEYRQMLTEYENDGIIKYHGEVSDTALFLQNVHCQIHPSYYPEGISNVCLEAAASGRPVITTNRPGCRETVDDKVTGYVVEQKNREQLIEATREFMRLSNDKRRYMGINGRKKMEKEFDRNIVVRSYIEEINKR
mgnify:CR=1 FL=1